MQTNDQTAQREAGSSPATLLGGKRETQLLLPNETKIRFCNALDALRGHAAEGTSGECAACSIYMRHGDGDLCEQGKAIIAKELCFADTSLEVPPNFTLDPCSTHANAKCPKHYTIAENGLAQSWQGERVFMNPPYGRVIGDWMKKAYEESKGSALVVCLVPARTDTAWWHDYAAKGEIHFVRGRLKFGGQKNSAPFPSAVITFRPQNTICAAEWGVSAS